MALIKEAKEPEYAETAADALAAQSRLVSVKRDMGPLADLMASVAGNRLIGRLPKTQEALVNASSALKRKLGH